jgi:hypothetical protein
MAIWTAARMKNGGLALTKRSPEYGVEDLGSMPENPRDQEALLTWLCDQGHLAYGDVIVMPDRAYMMHTFDARA